jgi:hypothetical protein
MSNFTIERNEWAIYIALWSQLAKIRSPFEVVKKISKRLKSFPYYQNCGYETLK